MPIIHSPALTLQLDFEIRLAELLLSSQSPNSIIVIEEILDGNGMVHQEVLIRCNFNGYCATVKAFDGANNGELEINYYMSPDAYKAEYAPDAATNYDHLDGMAISYSFVELYSPYYGKDVLEVAAQSVLALFLCGGQFPDIEAYRKQYPKFGESYNIRKG